MKEECWVNCVMRNTNENVKRKAIETLGAHQCEDGHLGRNRLQRASPFAPDPLDAAKVVGLVGEFCSASLEFADSVCRTSSMSPSATA